MKSRLQKVNGGIIAIILIFLITLTQAQGKLNEDLPLQLFPQSENNGTLVIYVTGDGGWNTFSQLVTKDFGKQGYSVIGFDSKKYFWDAKSPEQFAHDMEGIINRYFKEWKKSSCLIVGYSFGADVIVFLPKHLPSALQEKIVLMALISPGSSTDFEVHVSDLLSDKDPTDRKFKTRAEIQQSKTPTVCIFGSEEKLLLKNELRETSTLHLIELEGSHHFNHDTETIVRQILTRLPR